VLLLLMNMSECNHKWVKRKGMIYCKLCKEGFVVSTPQYLIMCKWCKKEFVSSRKNKMYCSEECAYQPVLKRSLEYRTEHREEQAEKSLLYYHAHKDKYKDRILKKKYGVTLEQVNSMIVSQGGVCAICMEKFRNAKDTHVDHNHQSGQVRQLLCNNCNRGLGEFKENQLTLQRAIEYLQKWNK
jgi:hypothetical protein